MAQTVKILNNASQRLITIFAIPTNNETVLKIVLVSGMFYEPLLEPRTNKLVAHRSSAYWRPLPALTKGV